MIFVSRYFNPELKQNRDKYTIIRISVGTPRFLPYKLDGSIKELMPVGLLDIENRIEFREKYFEQLDKCGVETIGQQLYDYSLSYKPLVLCCYEDIRKHGRGDWCHRTMFAEWWMKNTDESVRELEDPSPYKLNMSDTPFMDIVTGLA